MGYRVDYEPAKKRGGFLLPLAAVLAAAVLLVGLCWPEGAEVLRDALVPGDPAVTAAALEEFAGEVHAGVPVGEALERMLAGLLEEADNGA